MSATVATSYNAAQTLSALLRVPCMGQEDLQDFLVRAGDNLRQSGRDNLLPFRIGRLIAIRTEYMILHEVMSDKLSADFVEELDRHEALEPLLMFDSRLRGPAAPHLIYAIRVEQDTNGQRFFSLTDSLRRGMIHPACMFNTKRGWRIAAYPFRNFVNRE